jgi:hypothetical protein
MKEAPIGVKLNNPGNVYKSKDVFQGEVVPSKSEVFKEFDTMQNGVRCVAKIMLTYWDHYNFKTLNEIIPRYAPPKDARTGLPNNTKEYIIGVCQMLDVRANEPLDLLNPSTLTLLVKGIVRQEQGYRDPGVKDLWVDDWTIHRGVDDAIGSLRDLKKEDLTKEE